MVELLFKELSELKEVEAIALGGSRAGENYDEKSDYDVYVYINSPVDEKNRKNSEDIEIPEFLKEYITILKEKKWQ